MNTKNKQTNKSKNVRYRSLEQQEVCKENAKEIQYKKKERKKEVGVEKRVNEEAIETQHSPLMRASRMAGVRSCTA